MRSRMMCIAISSVLSVFAAVCGAPADAKGPNAPVLQRSRRYPLINPLLDIEYPVAFVELKPFRDEIEALVRKQLAKKRASEVAVYFRDLNNGYWTGVNERAEFTPASLLKVPLMMTVFREAETDPDLLTRRLICAPEHVSNYQLSTDVKPLMSVQVGMEYPVEELLRRMSSYSDNAAALMLAGTVSRDALAQTFSDLGVEFSTPGALSGPLSVKQYASFLRILYNASYLSKRHSQKALEFLSESSFGHGLAAGVPPGVVVAHKFGERQDGAVRQLHDCGIVYHPKEHYLLCVMTRGRDTAELTGVIAEVSRLVYDEVSAQLTKPRR